MVPDAPIVTLLAASAVGAAVAAIVIDRLIAGARAHGLLDVPNERSLHVTPVPRGGGLGIMAGMAAAAAVLQLAGAGGFLMAPGVAAVLAAVLVLSAVSFYDDWRTLSPFPRFSAQVVVAAGVVALVPLDLAAVHVPVVGVLPLGRLSAVASVLLLVWMTNLYNFMDGMDGLAGTMTVLGFAVISALALRAADQTLAALAMLPLGAAAVFLIFNWPPARVFMGDVGSVPLGFLAGAVILMGARTGSVPLWSGILAFFPFIVDATLTLLHRAVTGQRVWAAHRQHFYQRLVLAGWKHGHVLGLEIGWMAASAAAAWVFAAGSEGWRAAALTAAILLSTVFMASGTWLAGTRRGSVVDGKRGAGAQ